ncbi:MAG: NAD-dependent DNA ligase LigA [Spirochaetaceae bacterium]|nr:NAD-dependent DNA ligase LigA [Spirochaetaceae bacterium]
MYDKEKLYNETVELNEKLLTYQKSYYVDAKPLVTDREYDRLFDRLQQIEGSYPYLCFPTSPTHRVGSDLSSDFPEFKHTIPVLSLDKAYDTSLINSWIEKCETKEDKELSFVLEQKIDGISIVLYYEKGELVRGVTRGNGAVGNDVTNNVKTIFSIPLKLTKPIDIAVRGEIYLPKAEFEKINETLEETFANPRNLCAGTIRRKKSSESAKIPLNIFVYEGFWPGDNNPFSTHLEILAELKTLGFRINPTFGVFCNSLKEAEERLNKVGLTGIVGSYSDLSKQVEIQTNNRSSLAYEIDGLVMKVNELKVREKLGYTVHHPRWAIAYKFESPQAESIIESIDEQVGRTGRVTPVARIKAVSIGGSTVKNVTLHNQAYIDELELAIGDSVEVSKRGDVIPAVENVVEKNEVGNTTYRLPLNCPVCDTELIQKGAHTFCPNPYCPSQVLGRLEFFVGKSQMDITSLGPKTVKYLVDTKMVSDVQDLYTADIKSLVGQPGFGDKKVNTIIKGLEESKRSPFSRVLVSLGIPEVGKKIVDTLIENGLSSMEKIFDVVEKEDYELLEKIPLIARKTSENIFMSLKNPVMIKRIADLKEAGLAMVQENDEEEVFEQTFVDEVWCVTGSFENYNPRIKALEEIEKRGGRTVTSITGKTTHLLLGNGGGSKVAKAKKLGIKIVKEPEFIEKLNETSKNDTEVLTNIVEKKNTDKKIVEILKKDDNSVQGELF